MKTIYKYQLNTPISVQGIEMPKGAEIIKVGNQFDLITIWAIVDTEAEKELVEINVFGRGHEMYTNEKTERQYLDSVFIGPLVWHVFKRLK